MSKIIRYPNNLTAVRQQSYRNKIPFTIQSLYENQHQLYYGGIKVSENQELVSTKRGIQLRPLNDTSKPPPEMLRKIKEHNKKVSNPLYNPATGKILKYAPVEKNYNRNDYKNILQNVRNSLTLELETITNYNSPKIVGNKLVYDKTYKIKEVPFQVEWRSAIADVKPITKTFNNFNAFKKLLDFVKTADESAVDSILGSSVKYTAKNIFDIVKIRVSKPTGGCNKKKNTETKVKLEGSYYNIHNPNSSGYCGNKCIEYILNKDKLILRAKENTKFATLETLQEIYNNNKSSKDKPLLIISGKAPTLEQLEKYNVILLRNNHFVVILGKSNKEVNKPKKDRKNFVDAFWDTETHKGDRTAQIGKASGRFLDVAICHLRWETHQGSKYINHHKKFDGENPMLEFKEFLKTTDQKFRLYAHNATNFDNHFFLSVLTDEEMADTKNFDICKRGATGILTMQYRKHEFLDTCLHLSKSLETLCKDFGLPAELSKITELELYGEKISSKNLCFYENNLTMQEFRNLKYTKPEYWKALNDYCERDCIALQEIWKIYKKITTEILNTIENTYIKKGIKKAKGVLLKNCKIGQSSTLGSWVKKIYDTVIKEFHYNKYKSLAEFINSSEKEKYLRKCITGGISHCSKPAIYVNQIVDYDMKSQYPAAKLNSRIPVGKSRWVKVFSKDTIGYYHLKNLVFESDKKYKPVPDKVLGVSLNWNTENNIISELYVDTDMILYLQEKYGLISFEVVDGLVSDNYLIGNDIYGITENIFFDLKKSEDDKKSKGLTFNSSLREVVKLCINAYTGKCVEDKTKYTTLEYTKDEDKDEDKEYKNIQGTSFNEKNTSNHINHFLTVGLSIYSMSKRMLFDYMDCLPNGSDDVIHTETDGIVFPKSLQETFIENIKLKMLEKDCPAWFGIGEECGNMALECMSKDGTLSYFLGKKAYAFIKSNGTEVVKLKGIRNKSINEDGSDLNVLSHKDYAKIATGVPCSFTWSGMKRNIFGEKQGIIAFPLTRTVQFKKLEEIKI